MAGASVKSRIRWGAVLVGLGLAAGLWTAGPRAAGLRRVPASAPLSALRDLQGPADASGLRYTGARARALADAFERRLDYIPGEALVKFKNGVTVGGAQRALSSLNGQPSVDTVRWSGEVAVVSDPATPDARALARTLAAQPEVQYAEPNRIHPLPTGERTDFGAPIGIGRPEAVPTLVPTDPSYSRQWNFPDIGAERGWGINPGGSSAVIVAVVDTGVTTTAANFTFPMWDGAAIRNFSIPYTVSPDLSASKFVSEADFVFFNAGAPVLDMGSHGTHVASTIAEATNNGVGLAGLAYNVRIMPVKVCMSYWEAQIIRSNSGIPGFSPFGSGGCPSDAVAAGIRWAADNGAKVLNLSLGGTTGSQVEHDALVYAVSKGTFAAISMGNNFETGNATNYPAAFAPDINGAMSVASTGRSRTKSYFSATGPYAEIAAPGGSTRDGAGGTGLIWQITQRQADIDEQVLISPRFDRYEETGFQGTSMASPHVAALAALVASQMPGITPAGIEQVLRETALDLGPAGKDDQFGYGLIQVRAALFGKGGRK